MIHIKESPIFNKIIFTLKLPESWYFIHCCLPVKYLDTFTSPEQIRHRCRVVLVTDSTLTGAVSGIFWVMISVKWVDPTQPQVRLLSQLYTRLEMLKESLQQLQIPRSPRWRSLYKSTTYWNQGSRRKKKLISFQWWNCCDKNTLTFKSSSLAWYMSSYIDVLAWQTPHK